MAKGKPQRVLESEIKLRDTFFKHKDGILATAGCDRAWFGVSKYDDGMYVCVGLFYYHGREKTFTSAHCETPENIVELNEDQRINMLIDWAKDAKKKRQERVML